MMGRQGWFDEVMRFYDRFLKGIAPTRPTTRRSRCRPTTARGARSSRGRPPTRRPSRRAAPGTYTDDGQNNGTGRRQRAPGVWTISPPLPYDAHLAGVPTAARVDVASRRCRTPTSSSTSTTSTPAATATLITPQAYLMRGDGQATLDLCGATGRSPPGTAIGVRSPTPTPTGGRTRPTLQTVTRRRARASTLPFLHCTRTETIQGGPSVKLDQLHGGRAVHRRPRRRSPATPTRASRCRRRWSSARRRLRARRRVARAGGGWSRGSAPLARAWWSMERRRAARG